MCLLELNDHEILVQIKNERSWNTGANKNRKLLIVKQTSKENIKDEKPWNIRANKQ